MPGGGGGGGAPGLIYSRESRAPVMGASQHTACASLRGFELHNARAPSLCPCVTVIEVGEQTGRIVALAA